MRNRPTKKSFYEYMSTRFKKNYKDPETYDALLEIISDARDESKFMDLAELTLMNKTDRLIYRNRRSCEGTEMTPLQVDEYLATVEFALEFVT